MVRGRGGATCRARPPPRMRGRPRRRESAGLPRRRFSQVVATWCPGSLPGQERTRVGEGSDMSQQVRPPMDPDTSEATQRQLELAREQGEAYGRALEHMTGEVAHDGGEQEAGHFLVGYAVEEAEGMYEWTDGRLAWRDPAEDENLHL